MTTMTRSQIVSHPAAADIEYRITRHQPYKSEPGGTLVEDGDPHPVVELFKRDHRGELERVARFNMNQFIELHREVVVVGRELCPKVDGDEPSTDVPD